MTDQNKKIKELEERVVLLEDAILELQGIKLSRQSKPLIPCYFCKRINCRQWHAVSSPL